LFSSLSFWLFFVAGVFGDSRSLTIDQYINAAAQLGVHELATLKAIDSVESGGSGFLQSGKPKILFERHLFRQFTNPVGRFDGSHPSISSRTPGGYYGGEREWLRFNEAAGLDSSAAIRASSWGRFQILGSWYKTCGYPTPQAYKAAMEINEGYHLDCLVKFIKNQPFLVTALNNHQWATFARSYNGAGYAANHYDTKLASAYSQAVREGWNDHKIPSNPAPTHQATRPPSPVPPPPAPGGGYIGCYVDTPDRDLPHLAFATASTTIKACREKCGQLGYLYAGLQDGKECWCGNSYGKHGLASAAGQCDMQCAGDFGTVCGAAWRISLYHAGPGATVDPPVTTAKPSAPPTAKPVPPRPATLCTTDAVRLRTGPGLQFATLTVIPSGKTVTDRGLPLSTSADAIKWRAITYNGMSGYSANQYLGGCAGSKLEWETDSDDSRAAVEGETLAEPKKVLAKWVVPVTVLFGIIAVALIIGTIVMLYRLWNEVHNVLPVARTRTLRNPLNDDFAS